MVATDEADQMLLSFTADGTIPITHWLRVENLREDFTDFVRQLRPLSLDESRTIVEIETKKPMPYDHDFTKVFTDEQLRRLYSSNPVWAEVESRIYGDLVTGN
jgi:hypothetical protein